MFQGVCSEDFQGMEMVLQKAIVQAVAEVYS
jgi:hypothetical protein